MRIKKTNNLNRPSARQDKKTNNLNRPSAQQDKKRYKPTVYNTRAVATEVLNQILYRGRLSEDALNSGFLKIPRQDKKLLHALCFGVLRWHGRLSLQALFLIGKQKADLHPKVQLILEIGIWQLAQGYAEHAAIYQCVEACEQIGLQRAKNFVNAILRKAQEQINLSGWKLEDQSCQLPEWLESVLQAQDFCQDPALRLGAYTSKLVAQIQPVSEQIYKRLMDFHPVQPIISLRIQTNRIKLKDYQIQLEKIGIQSEVGHYSNSLLIKQPVQVEKLPGYAVGAVVVQDISAQCAAHILNPKPQMKVLDACAAPGGKASHLQEIANNQLELTALEIDEYRSRRLRENLGRTRTQGKVVIGSASNPSEWWAGRPFQAILVDVPCSGTGVMRRHPDIPWVRKKEDIIRQSAESLKILNRLWALLQEDCCLLFVTCSVLPEENDFVIEQFLRLNSSAKTLDFHIPLDSINTIHGKQILPQYENDSLYYCLLTKSNPLTNSGVVATHRRKNV